MLNFIDVISSQRSAFDTDHRLGMQSISEISPASGSLLQMLQQRMSTFLWSRVGDTDGPVNIRDIFILDSLTEGSLNLQQYWNLISVHSPMPAFCSAWPMLRQKWPIRENIVQLGVRQLVSEFRFLSSR